MIFSVAKINEIDEIMSIVNQAKQYFKDNRIDQWQDGYPNEKTIMNDISNNIGFVLVNDHEIIAYFALDFNGEKTYDKIYEGQWLNDDKYATIHRICVKESEKGKHVANDIMIFCKNFCKKNKIKDIRVDTHKENLSMRKMLQKNDFIYCGIVYIRNDVERIAFQCEF